MTRPSAGPSVAGLVSGVIGSGVTGRERAAAMSALIGQLGVSARSAGLRAVVAGRWLADVTTEVVPHVAVRDAAALRRAYPGLTDDAISERLVVAAGRLTAAIGAAAGALSAAEFVAPPALAAAPIQIAAETVAVVTVEIRMVAELHEIAGYSVPGGLRESAPAYLQAWIRRRAVGSGAGLSGLVGDATKHELRSRLLRRMGRNTATLAPFLAGAAAGAEVNRRSTRDLGQRVRTELLAKQRPYADVVVDYSLEAGTDVAGSRSGGGAIGAIAPPVPGDVSDRSAMLPQARDGDAN